MTDPKPFLSEAELAALLSNQPGAWEAFVPRAAAVMRAPIRRLLTSRRHQTEIGDVLQDCFLRLVAHDYNLLRRYDPARGTLSTWLGVIATSVTLDHLRKKTPGGESLEDNPEALAVPLETARRDAPLDLPPDLLTPRQALILKLLYEDDLDPDEVGAMLGIGAPSVRSLHHKAVSRLRAYYKERGGYD